MKKLILPALGLVFFSLAGSRVIAQEKEKTKESLGEYDQIIIKRKGDKGDKGEKGEKGDKEVKLTIVISDNKIEVNGKPLAEFDDERVAVLKRNIIIRDGNTMRIAVPGAPRSPFRDGEAAWERAEARAFLGVASEKSENGVVVTEVTGESAAEKAGLKAGDIITKVDDQVITAPEDLSKTIGKHKPEDKVTITYKRSGKESRSTVTLGRRQDVMAFGEMPFFQGPERREFRLERLPGEEFNFNFGGGQPKLGIRAQDTEEARGVKVIEVDKESAAEKAGVKEGDIITSVDGRVVNSVNELVEGTRAAREAKKASMTLKLLRDKKEQSVEIRIPRRLRTAEL